MGDSYIGVSIHREKAWLTFGKKDEIKLFNTPDGTLKIMATKVDFLAKSLTVSERKFPSERVMQMTCHILNVLYVPRQEIMSTFFKYVTWTC